MRTTVLTEVGLEARRFDDDGEPHVALIIQVGDAQDRLIEEIQVPMPERAWKRLVASADGPPPTFDLDVLRNPSGGG